MEVRKAGAVNWLELRSLVNIGALLRYFNFQHVTYGEVNRGRSSGPVVRPPPECEERFAKQHFGVWRTRSHLQPIHRVHHNVFHAEISQTR